MNQRNWIALLGIFLMGSTLTGCGYKTGLKLPKGVESTADRPYPKPVCECESTCECGSDCCCD